MQRNLVNHEIKLRVKFAALDEFVEIADLTNVDLTINGTIQEWNSYDMNGWTSRLATGKSLDLACQGKYLHGNPIHKELVRLMFADANKLNDMEFELVFPLTETTNENLKAATLKGKGVLNFNGSELLGSAIDVSPLNFEIKCNGKPIYTEEIEILEIKDLIKVIDVEYAKAYLPVENDETIITDGTLDGQIVQVFIDANAKATMNDITIENVKVVLKPNWESKTEGKATCDIIGIGKYKGKIIGAKFTYSKLKETSRKGK